MFYVLLSDENRHDAKFIFALIQSLIPILKNLLPNLEFVHYWTNSPFSQYRNKTILKIISCHEEYFNVSASWNYMETGHGKGLCDPIGGTAKGKADQAVKYDKAVIKDAFDFYKWEKNSEERSVIKFLFLSTADYERSSSFLTKVCTNICRIDGTAKLHVVFPSAPNKIWVRDMSCFCQNCFDTFFKPETTCIGCDYMT